MQIYLTRNHFIYFMVTIGNKLERAHIKLPLNVLLTHKNYSYKNFRISLKTRESLNKPCQYQESYQTLNSTLHKI